MKKFFCVAALCVLPFCARAQEWEAERLDSAVVSASRAGERTPVTFTSVSKDQLSKANPMNSLPMALNLLPSVVTYNEGGTGLGNSAMTIRGSKGSQINVTLNGITLNDAESQEVFWVNIPALTALLSGVQVQRGLGTTANGAGAFGASVNMNTAFVGASPTGSVELSAGSYGTFIGSFAGSTGLMKKGWYFNVAANLGRTDGYIRNAFVRSSSVFAVIGKLSDGRSFRFTYLMGTQRSGITWDGISLEQYAIDRRYNGAGEYTDDEGNICYYPNQTDNYTQHHLQLNETIALNSHITWTNTLNYTRGDGYDEYYKTNRKIKNYGFPATTVPARSDMTYRKKMNNDYWVFNSSLLYRSQMFDATFGVNWSNYRASHWGEVLWLKTVGDVTSPEWYTNKGLKRDRSIFLRGEYRPSTFLTAYADLQYRQIGYHFTGVDSDWIEYGQAEEDRLDYHDIWRFFNPRAGVTADWGPHRAYASVAFGHREPSRSDIKENIKGDGLEIRPEKMLDVELGYQFTAGNLVASANIYWMEYWDMLLETGRLSDSGYALKENMPRAWRRGLELAATWQPRPWVRVDANATFSVNQIADYTSYVPYDDYSGATFPVRYGRTTMLMSPSVIGMLQGTFFLWKGGRVNANGKLVGKQYLDNSMREELAVPAYFIVGTSVSQTFRFGASNLDVTLYINNLFNHLYYAAGWRWEAYSPQTGQISLGSGVYPQAPINATLKVRYSF
ncbi:MAG: TonB-dependent receptor plug domain-containing protein [Bacteroidales bacterium]|nr:TonB-dependent receptor plug domain-containing protein [Bacteroidales bacterium]